MTGAAMLAAFLALSPARAQGAKGEFSDASIERRKAELDAAFHQVEFEAEHEFQDSVAFHARLKEERLDFERRMLSSRKAMLDNLRGLPASRRKEVYERFHADEARRRRDFSRQVAAEKASFRKQYLEERSDARRELLLRRQALPPGRRSL